MKTTKKTAKKATKKATKKEAKKKVAKKTNRRGIGVNAKWVEIFTDIANGVPGKDYTDAEITQIMQKTFPDRQSKVFEQVALVRSRFNRGALSGQKSAPKKKAYKIVEED